jgi:hypothetical protein
LMCFMSLTSCLTQEQAITHRSNLVSALVCHTQQRHTMLPHITSSLHTNYPISPLRCTRTPTHLIVWFPPSLAFCLFGRFGRQSAAVAVPHQGITFISLLGKAVAVLPDWHNLVMRYCFASIHMSLTPLIRAPADISLSGTSNIFAPRNQSLAPSGANSTSASNATAAARPPPSASSKRNDSINIAIVAGAAAAVVGLVLLAALTWLLVRHGDKFLASGGAVKSSSTTLSTTAAAAASGGNLRGSGGLAQAVTAPGANAGPPGAAATAGSWVIVTSEGSRPHTTRGDVEEARVPAASSTRAGSHLRVSVRSALLGGTRSMMGVSGVIEQAPEVAATSSFASGMPASPTMAASDSIITGLVIATPCQQCRHSR